MYTPRAYVEDDAAVLRELIRRFPFALLVSAEAGAISGTHLPFELEPDRGEKGTLVAHMARANPHWRQLARCEEALVVFQGPHAYVSPGWYAKQTTVPTWNYAVAHVYGRPSIVDDPARLRASVEGLVARFESEGSPWKLSSEVVTRELPGIVGFEIAITRIEGKIKLNQNRAVADREGAAAALLASVDPVERGVGEMMTAQLRGEPALSDGRGGACPRPSGAAEAESAPRGQSNQ